MGHPESAACCWDPALPSPACSAGTHAPAPGNFCAPCPAPSSPHSQSVPSQRALAHSLASPLAPGVLNLQRGAAVSPGAHLSLSWQGILPAGLCLFLIASQALPVSHLHSSTSRWNFPRRFWAQQQLCCHFWDVWIWVCTEDPRAGHYLDFAHWMSVLCSLNHTVFLSSINSSPPLNTLVWTSPNTFPRENRFQL